MANTERGFVPITLDKERTLNYTLNSLIDIEEKLGVPMEEMGDIKMSIKNVRVLLWAGLTHEDEKLTERQVGAMVNLTNLGAVQEKVTEAFSMVELGKN